MFKCSLQSKMGMLDISCGFEVEKNRLLVILGPSGCGKSTLLNLITGIKEPEGGSVAIDGRTLYDSEASINQAIGERHIGYIQQSGYLFPHMTVKENMLYSIPKKNRAQYHDKYRELIQLLGIASHENAHPSELSGGQKQRVAIGRALMMEPKLMLWDEPFSALDHMIRREMRQLVAKVKGELGIPMVFVTHDLEEAFDLADDLAVMFKGEILQHGTKYDVLQNPVSEHVAELTGRTYKLLNGKSDKAPFILGISGVSNSGKTTIMENLIRGLRKKGYLVGTIKHDGRDYEIDHQGKDSYRHRHAGANRVIVASAKKYAVISMNDQNEVGLDELIKKHSDMDIILFEGYKFSKYRKFEVVRKAISTECVCDPQTLVGVITDFDIQLENKEIPVLGLDDHGLILNEVEHLIKEYNRERQ